MRHQICVELLLNVKIGGARARCLTVPDLRRLYSQNSPTAQDVVVTLSSLESAGLQGQYVMLQAQRFHIVLTGMTSLSSIKIAEAL